MEMKMFFQVVREKKDILESIARYAIRESMLWAWANSSGQPQEPDFVASLILNGTRILSKGWNLALDPCHLSVTGVYCHQSPKVTFQDMNKTSCELGDLLWCHVHTDRDGRSFRNAILYQAKVSHEQPYKSPRGDDQYRLYSTWPEFSYVNRPLHGQIRKVTPSTFRRGGQYLLIDDRPPQNPLSGLQNVFGTYPIGSCLACNPIDDHAPLEEELTQSLLFLAGDPFDDYQTVEAGNGIGWSRVVWDLLKLAAEKAYRRKNIGIGSGPRQTGAPISAFDGDLVFSSKSTEYSGAFKAVLPEDGMRTLFHAAEDRQYDEPNDNWFEEGSGGVSVVLVESNESREE
jgi:hypothetical protein